MPEQTAFVFVELHRSEWGSHVELSALCNITSSASFGQIFKNCGFSVMLCDALNALNLWFMPHVGHDTYWCRCSMQSFHLPKLLYNFKHIVFFCCCFFLNKGCRYWLFLWYAEMILIILLCLIFDIIVNNLYYNNRKHKMCYFIIIILWFIFIK